MKSCPNSPALGPAAVLVTTALVTTVLVTASLSGCGGFQQPYEQPRYHRNRCWKRRARLLRRWRPSIEAKLKQPSCVVTDKVGNLYIGDEATNTIRKVAAGTGIISTYAGNSLPGYSGDGGPAVSASMYGPAGCALDSTGNLYVAEAGNNIVRKIAASSGIITTVAGNGFGHGCGGGGFDGDGGPATKAQLFCPNGVAVDASGDLFISDTGNQRVREVNAQSGVITTIAGNGLVGHSGNGGAATDAMIANPEQLALDSSSNLYIAEQGASVIAKVNLSTGIISTVAGNGTTGPGVTAHGLSSQG